MEIMLVTRNLTKKIKGQMILENVSIKVILLSHYGLGVFLRLWVYT